MNAIKKVLLIEDNQDISQALGATLNEIGYEVDYAFNGKEGFDHLINHVPPNLILLDLFMPVMSGFEFRSRQLQIPYLAQIPVVMISADCCLKQRCSTLHLKHFLKKPFQFEDLLSILDSMDHRK